LQAASETKFADLRRLLAWEQGANGRKLVGVWALQLRKVAPFWPAVLEALPYNYAFVSSPVIDPLYVDVAIRRWQTFTGEAATLAITGETFAEIADRRGDPLQ